MNLPWCLAAVTVIASMGCGPAPGWSEQPDESAAAPKPAVLPERRAGDENPNCRMNTPQTRLMGRMNGFRGIEGMNSVACPPTPVVEAPPPGSP